MKSVFLAIGVIFIGGTAVNCEVRRCKCEEDNECRTKALRSVDKCSMNCGNLLASLGGDLMDMVNCFGDQRPAVEAEDACFRKKIDYDCDDDYQNHVVNDNSYQNIAFTFEEPPLPTVSPFLEQIYDALHVLFRYNLCIRTCYKNITAECYMSKGCGFTLPERSELIQYAKDCVGVHPLFYIEQAKACHCLVHKHHITKLSGACLHIANPFLKNVTR